MHHRLCRSNWRLVNAAGLQMPESVDFVELDRDGRIHRVVGFFGPLTRPSHSFLKERGRVKCGDRTGCDRFLLVSGVGAGRRR
jgi:hypothetical protein